MGRVRVKPGTNEKYTAQLLDMPPQLEPVRDKRAFKQILQSMNGALRDSHGGGIVERFEVISKLLFLKVFDEREVELGVRKRHEFQVSQAESHDAVGKRLDALWRRACKQYPFLYPNGAPRITQDYAAVHVIARLLQHVSILRTSGDIKGLAYEETLRNTFDKNENQQFFTPYEIVEFMVEISNPTGEVSVCDPACGTGGFLVAAHKHTNGRAQLTGAEIDGRLAHVAQLNLIMHGADRATVHHLRGPGALAPISDIKSALPPDSFDLILTNPPFGSDLSDRRALDAFETGRQCTSRRRSVLFTERCLDLLRPGGKLVIVLDDSVLNLASNQDIRALIRTRAIVEAVISLPDVAFMPYSTAKSSILVLRKNRVPRRTRRIFMSDVTQVGRRPNGDPLYSDYRDGYGNRQLLSELPEIAAAYRQFSQGEAPRNEKFFLLEHTQLQDRLDVFFYHPKRFVAEQQLAACRCPIAPLRDLVTVRRERVNPSRDLGDSPVRWLGLADIEDASGEYEIKVISADKIHSQANVFRGGDILFSRLRPNLRKVVLVPDTDEGGICSGEILVIRGADKETNGRLLTDDHSPVDSEYLAFMLRSDLIYGQFVSHVTGVGRPRVSQESILDVKIPLPPIEEQRRTVALLSKVRNEAVLARQEAARCLERAAHQVGEAYAKVMAELTRTNAE
jgi:predicted RNA methylase